jgi:4-amino-4-deoxy-L-arabinose transferase-like glycosyltransferase
MLAEASATFSKSFVQNVFLTWPWELQSGFILSPFALAGLYCLRRSNIGRLLGVWIAGCFFVFVLTAQHCATSHDYYGLPLVPPVAIATGFGIVAAFKWAIEVRGARKGCLNHRVATIVILLSLALPAAFLRISGRYGDPYDFAWGRYQVAQRIPGSARVLAVDDTPSALLYRVGLKGLNLLPDQMSASLISQYDYLLSFERFEKDVLANAKALGRLEFLFRDQGIAAYRIHPQN